MTRQTCASLSRGTPKSMAKTLHTVPVGVSKPSPQAGGDDAPQLVAFLLRHFVLSAFLVVLVSSVVWALAHWSAAPCYPVSVLYGLVEYTRAPCTVSPQTDRPADPPATRGVIEPSLPSDFATEAQARAEISRALQQSDIGRATEVVRGLRDGPARNEECGRVFGAALAVKLFGGAEVLAKSCWNGDQLADALGRISLARIRQ